MLPYMVNDYGNPHSRTHAYGWKAEEAVEKARTQVAAIIKADPREVVFTSGATESNNIAIKGVAKFQRHTGKNHVVTLQTEHKCVLDSCRSLETEGFKVTYLPVDHGGRVDLKLIGVDPGQSSNSENINKRKHKQNKSRKWKVCELIEAGAGIILGPPRREFAQFIEPICRELDVVFIKYHWDPFKDFTADETYGSATINLFPTSHFTTLLDKLLLHWKWDYFTFVYTNKDGTVFLDLI
ncbi:aminotransferase, class V [Necator americanus]|uniref:Aminotransferase, class V n=1 Tax=Necator americanus TaxID=51031 RepID=W2SP03_NECAM|nr:aminotransferase, class V [Necator americanus]ETN70432.1 aminotransferase, class V [Necator americanus]